MRSDMLKPDQPRANRLDGKAWTRNSISVWSDLRKTPEEARLKHPALFPAALASRLIACFAAPGDEVVLDPFAGLGSTLMAAAQAGMQGVGIELSAEFAAIARRRLASIQPPFARDGNSATSGEVAPDNPSPCQGEDQGEGGRSRQSPSPVPMGIGRTSPCEGEEFEKMAATIHVADARELLRFVAPESVDLVITSPPYWDILTRRRSADGKAVRNYGDDGADLGRIAGYDDFLAALAEVFAQVHTALRPGKYCIAVVMDLRKHGRFYPFHADLARRLEDLGFIYDDLLIWDRRQEYNRLRPLGYPAVFRINKVHEFALIFRKPTV
ncbi:MAG TPA: DNA methyltransferase [Armatimonadota bacterium]|nr:DNA methyltransferase [Armatimonadota bacterium]